jgi:hypothetical protein
MDAQINKNMNTMMNTTEEKDIMSFIRDNKIYVIKEETKEELEALEKEEKEKMEEAANTLLLLKQEPIVFSNLKLKPSGYLSADGKPYYAYHRGDDVISSMFG